MYSNFLQTSIKEVLDTLIAKQAFKTERVLAGPQGPQVRLGDRDFLMLASNNYLGLAANPEIVATAGKILKEWGLGMSSVRFIAGTTELHQELEKKLADFLGTESAMLFSSCFSANEAFFAALINEGFGQSSYQDAVYSDELNHASIIDALRLVKKEVLVKRLYPHGDLAELEKMLAGDKSKNFRFKIIATDGVFSMEGETAPLEKLLKLTDQYQALLFVDDSHGVGVLGKTGRGTPEQLGVFGKIDVLSGTLGKALGGALGGYLAGSEKIIEFLRQKARPYIFSNSLPPVIVGATLAALQLLEDNPALLKSLNDNTKYFRDKIKALGFSIIDGEHPIVPVMLKETALTQKMSQALLAEGLYVVGLWYPVVPEGQARLRVQISASHTQEHLDKALAIFAKVGKQLKII